MADRAGVPDWFADAACRGAPLDWFFPVGPDEAEPELPDPRAVALCEQCPARADCFAWAVATRSEGTFGGTSTFQRRQLTRRYHRRDCPVCGEPDGVIVYGEHQVCIRCAVSWLAARAHPASSSSPAGPARRAGS